MIHARLGIDQRKLRAGDHRHVLHAGDLQKAQRALHLLVAPLVAGDDRCAEHLGVGRGKKDQQRLEVCAARPGVVVVGDDVMRVGGAGRRNKGSGRRVSVPIIRAANARRTMSSSLCMEFSPSRRAFPQNHEQRG